MSGSLGDRLRGIIGASVPRVAAGVPEPAAPRWSANRLDAAGVASAAGVLGGSVIAGPEGPVIVVDRY
jgi:hypothetical protein